MSPYQHLFSTNAVLNVFRNLRSNRDQNDLLLTFQLPHDDRTRRFGDGGVAGKGASVGSAVDERDAAGRRRGMDGSRSTTVDAIGGGNGRSIGFVVPWRSMQAQKRELREKEKELAEALVVLAGEVAFTDLPDGLQTSLSHNPLIQVRHIAAGLSRQMSKIELQMADNAPFARGKNLYTGGEIARKFLPPIQTLFDQRPVPQRMIFELLIELKDLVLLGMADCDREVLEWELNNFTTFEDIDEMLVQALTPLPSPPPPSSSSSTTDTPDKPPEPRKRLLKPKANTSSSTNQHQQPNTWQTDQEETLYTLESLETTSLAMTHLNPPIPDFLAKSTITLRRMLDRRILNDFSLAKRRRMGRCAEYARCMKWSGNAWRQGGGCRRGCKNEDEDPESLPCWHSSSRHFAREGTYMLGSSGDDGDGDGEGVLRLAK